MLAKTHGGRGESDAFSCGSECTLVWFNLASPGLDMLIQRPGRASHIEASTPSSGSLGGLVYSC
eukprot:3940603-Rhodomonas_salina.1